MSTATRLSKARVILVGLLSLAAAMFAAADASAKIGIDKFDVTYLESNGDPANQAGGHPATNTTDIKFEILHANLFGNEIPFPNEALKDAVNELPPGFVGNPQSLPRCAPDQFNHQVNNQIFESCPTESQVGYVRIKFPTFFPSGDPEGLAGYLPLYNLDAPPGTPALFGFNVIGTPAYLSFKTRTGDDYGLTVYNFNAPTTLPLNTLKIVFWGIPADPAHDHERGDDGIYACVDPNANPSACDQPSLAPLTPFLSLPTSCGPAAESTLEADSWDEIGQFSFASSLSHDNSEPPQPLGFTGCNAVDFSPSLVAQPTTTAAAASSGLEVDIAVPQHEGCDPGPPATCETATAHLKDTVVTLPEGFVINPSSANGLGSCSEAEFGFTAMEGDVVHTTPVPGNCPDQAKIGNVEIESPLLETPMKGGIYLATPFENPFGSMLALYITVDDRKTGLVIKLAGEVNADPATGRITTTFLQNPQLPFDHFRLKLFGGAGGSLRTPTTCGQFATTSTMTPWTAPEGELKSPEDAWSIVQGPNGGPCSSEEAQEPNSPDFEAGTIRPVAGAFSPMVINLRRDDGTQTFSQVTVSLPPGLLGKLAGIPYCSDAALGAAAAKDGKAEKASPSCPPASRLGSVDVAAGAGPAPYWAQGTAYLAGPYKGAPVSMALITPATAGPFDLGTVVTRVALNIDPVTARITAVADPLPTILDGIPLNIRQALVRIDRDQFALNGTSCEPSAFDGQLLSSLGQAATLASRFQLGECSNLGLKPRISLRYKGGTNRRGHPMLISTLEPRPGDANLKMVSVALPRYSLLDQANIKTVCTRVQFAADQCPRASVYGYATVYSPILDRPLTGNVVLRSSSNPLPDLTLDLRGPADQPVKLEAAGRTDTTRSGSLRNTFENIPDAPVSKIVLVLKGGRGGLLQNEKDFCGKGYRAKVKYEAHNALTLTQHPKVKANCKGRNGKKKHSAHSQRAAG